MDTKTQKNNFPMHIRQLWKIFDKLEKPKTKHEKLDVNSTEDPRSTGQLKAPSNTKSNTI